MSLQTIQQIPDIKLFILAGVSVICFWVCFYLYTTMKHGWNCNCRKCEEIKLPKINGD